MNAKICCAHHPAADDGRFGSTDEYIARHAARTIGAARVDFLAYAAAADYLIV